MRWSHLEEQAGTYEHSSSGGQGPTVLVQLVQQSHASCNGWI